MSSAPPPPPSYQPPSYQPPAYAPPAYAPWAARRYAGFWARVGARLIDALIGLLFALPGIALLIASATQIEEDRFGDPEFTDAGAALFGLGLLLVLIGGRVFLILWMRKLGRGQSWGQKSVGISLVGKDDSSPIGAWRAFGRYVIAQLVSTSLLGLGYWWMLWDKDNQTWQDKIFNTVVVEV
jgi:uncharacterized RDD family membrane protein YckC